MTRILVVDDEPNMRTILRGLLSREGYTVEEASDGLEALSALERCGGDYQAIVTDLRMPGMDGMRLLGQVVERYPGRSVVVITAHGTVDVAVEAMRAGAFDFITKPFDKNELRSVVQKAVKTSLAQICLLYTSPSPRDVEESRMPSSA